VDGPRSELSARAQSQLPLVWLPEAGESGSSYALTITRLVFGRLHPEN
jgi:hypothetical protein